MPLHAQMALSHLFQPKLNLRLLRLGFSAARAKFVSSECSNGESVNNPLSKEAAAVDSGIMPVEQSVKETLEETPDFFSKVTSVEDLLAGYVGPNNSKGLSVLFMEHKDNLTETAAENERRKAGAELLDNQLKRRKTRPARTELVKNRVLVKFLQCPVDENDIRECFNNCGEILKIEFLNPQGPLFRSAYVEFKTREGFEKALKKSGANIHSGPIIVESPTSRQKNTIKIPVPALLGDPDIPSILVKNPTRTIKIEPLTKETSLDQIEEALAFCKSKISGFTIGSSHSVAYVEFETEIGKERALAKQCINVLGRDLVMLRIDCPRTTVVRIANLDVIDKSIRWTCKLFGDVSLSIVRSPTVLDVHYKLAEWPNMVKILNGLNGSVVKGRRLQAEPAPVFPPEVLLALWQHPEERKHLKDTVLALLHKLLENRLDTSKLK